MIQLLAPKNKISAKLQLSGSKSISNRFLVLNEVLALKLTLHNVSDAEDTQLLYKALEQIKEGDNTTIHVHHAGTDMRFLTAYLSITPGEWIITGSERMKQRPIGELVNALRHLGADITYLEQENFPPLKIKGQKLKGGRVEIDGSISSQFISALLLIAPTFDKGLELNLKGSLVSMPYINMTVKLLQHFGISVLQQSNLITVTPNNFISSTDTNQAFNIESDWSSASYWYSVCALTPKVEIELSILHAHSLQADSVLPKLFEQLGVKTIVEENTILLSWQEVTLTAFEYDFTDSPDIAQTIAVTCFALGIEANLNGLQTLKVKETDRILALKTELEKFGAEVEITEKSMFIKGAKTKRSLIDANNRQATDQSNIHIDTYNDHRMAMSFAPLASVYGSLTINNPQVVAKSYPRFWEDLKSVGFSVNLLS